MEPSTARKFLEKESDLNESPYVSFSRNVIRDAAYFLMRLTEQETHRLYPSHAKEFTLKKIGEWTFHRDLSCVEV